jgi:hypothetical protein
MEVHKKRLNHWHKNPKPLFVDMSFGPERNKNVMVIGVGVSTYNRPKTLKLWLKQFLKHTQNLPDHIEVAYHIQNFYPNKHSGIAAVKNECLRELLKEKCDYYFLFDDDCFPINDLWYAPFIEAHLRTGQHHFLWLKDDSAIYPPSVGRKLLKEENGVTVFRNAQGCCMFMTRNVIDEVGGYDEKFGLYGSEHENYSLRAFKMGYNTFGPYLSTPGIEEYIHSLDVCGTKGYVNQLGNEVDFFGRLRSAGNPAKMKASAAKNEKILREDTTFQIPL